MRTIQKPLLGEYPEYSKIYMDLLEDDGKVLEHLWANFLKIREYVHALPEEKLYYRYADNKWTIKEILVHLIDDERIFSYRALRYARNDDTPLHGFDQDVYAKSSNANARSLESIFDEYETVRKATISLFKNLPEESFTRKGCGIEHDGSIVNERSVRGLAYHIAGHELRHFNIIKERYMDR
ncbi:DinB family protein [Allomuricauda sp. SCSIO 65647]|uniref:DinB family protein n=1 Tax=Allomuricauda sp. SCSIO 65647 TaxID=2908843 RepID=UPI001F3FF12C|nr:DinB family protein [Muricauda sp. SCSIO 65647]UJH69134.1 DinB family protein [Muricauda sp. SCSIO 65647]